MIILMRHNVEWELILQKKKALINIDNNLGSLKRVDYDYKVYDKVKHKNKEVNKYKTPYKDPLEITYTWINGRAKLKI